MKKNFLEFIGTDNFVESFKKKVINNENKNIDWRDVWNSYFIEKNTLNNNTTPTVLSLLLETGFDNIYHDLVWDVWNLKRLKLALKEHDCFQMCLYVRAPMEIWRELGNIKPDEMYEPSSDKFAIMILNGIWNFGGVRNGNYFDFLKNFLKRSRESGKYN